MSVARMQFPRYFAGNCLAISRKYYLSGTFLRQPGEIWRIYFAALRDISSSFQVSRSATVIKRLGVILRRSAAGNRRASRVLQPRVTDDRNKHRDKHFLKLLPDPVTRQIRAPGTFVAPALPAHSAQWILLRIFRANIIVRLLEREQGRRRNVCIFITVISARRTRPTYINLCVELYARRSGRSLSQRVASDRNTINLTTRRALRSVRVATSFASFVEDSTLG